MSTIQKLLYLLELYGDIFEKKKRFIKTRTRVKIDLFMSILDLFSNKSTTCCFYGNNKPFGV